MKRQYPLARSRISSAAGGFERFAWAETLRAHPERLSEPE